MPIAKPPVIEEKKCKNLNMYQNCHQNALLIQLQNRRAKLIYHLLTPAATSVQE
ncbi:hypothetical protein TSUD_329350 [Trifolium subterraneum]|uniref:Uncharacterized protein n=1 Tax=Trifolium subterraneum TaxID=3900 RepID=A0A2Z6P0V3_TRISU|nr:hypothetical protein TSUD_329350 [Trifolium subterraneum]